MLFKNSAGAGKCLLFKRMTTNQRKKILRELDQPMVENNDAGKKHQGMLKPLHNSKNDIYVV